MGCRNIFTIPERQEAMNKFNYLYVLQGNYGYGHGWEDLSAADNSFKGWKEIKADKKCYVENEGGNYRIIERRELNPEWVTANG